MELSAEERKLYDRQLRVWGAEAQERLKNAQVLIIKAENKKIDSWKSRGVRDELVKNLALAGVGKISLGVVRDSTTNTNEMEKEKEERGGDEPSAKRVRMLEGMRVTMQLVQMQKQQTEDQADKNQYHDQEEEEEEEEETIAAALRDMNPLVNSSVMHLPADTSIETYTDVLKAVQCAVILHGDEGEQMVRVVSAAARAIDASSTSAGGGTGTSSGSSVGVYVVDVRGARGYFASDLGDVHRFREEGEQAKKGEIVVKYPRLQDVLAVEQSSLPKRLRRTAREEKEWQTHAPSDPAVDAIVGGVLAQDIVRFISKKGRPIFNFFCFNGAGWVLPLAMRDGDGEQHLEEEQEDAYVKEKDESN